MSYSVYRIVAPGVGRVTGSGEGTPPSFLLDMEVLDGIAFSQGTYLDLTQSPPAEIAGYVEPGQAERKLAAWRAQVFREVPDFALAAVAAGHITEADADAWITRNSVPAVIAGAVARLPAAQRPAARLRIMGATVVRRDSPFVALLAQHIGLTDAQVDALFGGPPAEGAS